MKKINLPNSKLFQGFTESEIQSILGCLNGVIKHFGKEDYIFRMGEYINSVGLVLKGSVHILKEDFWGNRQILSSVEEGQLFGESYACMRGEPLMVSVIASQQAEIIFLDIKKILHTCSFACDFHNRLVENLLSIISGKNLMLTQKIDHMSKKTIREKVLSYLSSYANKQGSNAFEIPFNRQELADYLAIDRSALSAELSRMQNEKLILYKRNHFTLL